MSKQSLTSREPNQTLSLGPLPLPFHGTSCSLSVAHLGYVLSSYSMNSTSDSTTNGDLELSCVGCNCSTVAGSFSSEHRPFPIVPTRMDARATNGTFFASLNASVRASTSFWVQQRAEAPCYLHVRHLRHQAPPRTTLRVPTTFNHRPSATSQVQMTSLALREASPSDVVG